MKTDDLIRVMAADTTQVAPVQRILPAAILVTATISGLVFFSTMGVRPDLSTALGQTDVLLKHGFPVVMALAALGATIRLSRPEARLGGWGWALLVAPAVVTAAFWITAASTPISAWPAAIAGHSIAACLSCIPLIGLPILGGALWTLRRGANVRPAVLGALAGLLSGSTSASVYAAYCTDDSPMFWGIWYVLAIVIVTGVGALIGSRVLRW